MHVSVRAKSFLLSSFGPTVTEPGLSHSFFDLILNCSVSENRLSAAALLARCRLSHQLIHIKELCNHEIRWDDELWLASTEYIANEKYSKDLDEEVMILQFKMKGRCRITWLHDACGRHCFTRTLPENLESRPHAYKTCWQGLDYQSASGEALNSGGDMWKWFRTNIDYIRCTPGCEPFRSGSVIPA